MDAAMPTDAGAVVQPPKRKRGRPPKNPAAAEAAASTQQAATPQQASPNADAAQPAKRRGRPPGVKNRLIKNYGNPMVPQVIMIASGEDVYEKLRDLSRAYRRSLVVLAASGLLSAATLMQLKEGGQGAAVTLTGSFTVLSISGALLQPVEPHAASSSSSAKRDPCTQFLSASLANPSGGVVGGMVAGPLVAAGPVMVIIGHWEPDKRQQADAGNGGSAAAAGGAAAMPAAAATADDDSGGDGDDIAAGGDAVVLQQLGGVDLAAAVAAAAAAAAAAGDEGLLGLPIEQLQGLLRAAAGQSSLTEAAEHEDRSRATEQAGAGWCCGLGLGGEAGSSGQYHDDEEEQQQQHEQEEGDADD